MKTINGYQEIRLPGGEIRLVWVGGPHKEGFYSNGFIPANGADLSSMVPLSEAPGLQFEKAATGSILDLINKYWIWIALGFVALIILKK